jgi:hypothetical protein
MINQYYVEIEKLLLEILNLLSNNFSRSEIQEVQVFIDVKEYGLALETIADIIYEENKQISNHILDLIYQLIDRMSLKKDAYKDRLKH